MQAHIAFLLQVGSTYWCNCSPERLKLPGSDSHLEELKDDFPFPSNFSIPFCNYLSTRKSKHKNMKLCKSISKMKEEGWRKFVFMVH